MNIRERAEKYLEDTPNYIIEENDTVGYTSRLIRDLLAENERLKAENERLLSQAKVILSSRDEVVAEAIRQTAAEVAKNGEGKIMYVDGKLVADQIPKLKEK